MGSKVRERASTPRAPSAAALDGRVSDAVAREASTEAEGADGACADGASADALLPEAERAEVEVEGRGGDHLLDTLSAELGHASVGID